MKSRGDLDGIESGCACDMDMMFRSDIELRLWTAEYDAQPDQLIDLIFDVVEGFPGACRLHSNFQTTGAGQSMESEAVLEISTGEGEHQYQPTLSSRTSACAAGMKSCSWHVNAVS